MQRLDVTREVRADLKNQQAAVLWFKGISGAGSNHCNLVEKKLAGLHRHTFLLDGDNVRHDSRDLGFSDADRSKTCAAWGKSRG